MNKIEKLKLAGAAAAVVDVKFSEVKEVKKLPFMHELVDALHMKRTIIKLFSMIGTVLLLAGMGLIDLTADKFIFDPIFHWYGVGADPTVLLIYHIAGIIACGLEVAFALYGLYEDLKAESKH
ncbi:hypothetical protein KTD31_03650 [Burkholderia multivorans]|jgi:hypothetical protein|uniref:hypothetical protein n=1 Tax=Burkholderia multivorans TaxID=87883 RepID=UPI001C246E40|nr:hypothetical protein [Burkholderia multivorans]MBU9200449.1 hypothetical protein [Burkholderia multivorans]